MRPIAAPVGLRCCRDPLVPREPRDASAPGRGPGRWRPRPACSGGSGRQREPAIGAAGGRPTRAKAAAALPFPARFAPRKVWVLGETAATVSYAATAALPRGARAYSLLAAPGERRCARRAESSTAARAGAATAVTAPSRRVSCITAWTAGDGAMQGRDHSQLGGAPLVTVTMTATAAGQRPGAATVVASGYLGGGAGGRGRPHRGPCDGVRRWPRASPGPEGRTYPILFVRREAAARPFR
jgi:hypothetical protein